MRLMKRATTRKAAKLTSRRATTGSTEPKRESGMVGKALSADEVAIRPSVARSARRTARTARADRGVALAGPTAVNTLDPEAAARQYLDRALAGETRKTLARPEAASEGSDFKSLGAEAVPLTGTTMVKFRQTSNKIPVYGSLVTVELDENNRCVGINSSTGTPKGVGHIAKISPAQAIAVAAKAAHQTRADLDSTPLLYYYYHPNDGSWRLAYIVENVPQKKRKVLKDGRGDAVLKDYVVDAHSGKLLAELPRTSTLAPGNETARDGTGADRVIAVARLAGGRRELRDEVLSVTTYDFAFKDPSAQSRLLPGTLCHNPPSWMGEAVSAHANGAKVAGFLRGVLRRNGIDNRGGEMISSVNCWDKAEGVIPTRQWKNAYWNGAQMVYGQIKFPDGSFYSIANMLDVVGHEMFHGVTDHSARLEYVTQAGALNESYSDIFGTIIENYGKPLNRWRWDIGSGWEGPGTALRSMREPTLHDQPKAMKNFREATPPYTYERNDYGWVHDNSGIHNFAAYRIMTAKNREKYVFAPKEIAALFYVALTQHLSRTSQFVDSRRAVIQAARSLFRNDSATERYRKIKAVENGYRAAGIL